MGPNGLEPLAVATNKFFKNQKKKYGSRNIFEVKYRLINPPFSLLSNNEKVQNNVF